MKKISKSLFLLSVFQVCNAGWWYSEATTIETVEFINDDELVEVTPRNIRLRKKLLKENDRKRAERAAAGEKGET